MKRILVTLSVTNGLTGLVMIKISSVFSWLWPERHTFSTELIAETFVVPGLRIIPNLIAFMCYGHRISIDKMKQPKA